MNFPMDLAMRSCMEACLPKVESLLFNRAKPSKCGSAPATGGHT